MEQQSDEELLRLYRDEHRREALEVLFKRYTHKVLGLCMSYLKNQQDGEDAAMEIFEGLCKTLRHAEVQRFQPWLYYVSRNHCLKRLTRKLEPRRVELSEINADLFMENGDDPAHYQEEQLEKLSDAIDLLKEEQRHCVVLFYLEQCSYKEIADRTSYSLNQVKSYIQNGKRNLLLSLNDPL